MNPDTARSRVRSGLLLLAALVAATPAAAQAPAWKLGLGASESWHSNVRLGTPTSGAFNTRVSLQLARSFPAPRWQLGLNGSASQSFFHGGSSSRLSRLSYAAGAQFGYQLSERASLTLADSFRSSYTGDVADLVGLGDEEEVLLPQTGQKRNSAKASLSFQVSSLMSASLSGNYYTALFKQDDVTQARLRNGDKLGGGLGLSRKLSNESSVNLGYTLSKSDQRVTTAYIHHVSLAFSHVLGEFTTAGLSIGASRRENVTDTTNALTGGLAIARQLENSSVSLRYGRNLGPLFGLGRDVVHDNVRLSAQRLLTRSLGVAVGGAYSRSRDPLDSSFGYNAWFANAGLNLNLFQLLQVHGGYSFARRSPLEGEAGRHFQAHRAALQLGWNTAF